MSRIVVTEYLTLDGVMEAPNEWSFRFWNDEAAKYKLDELMTTDALLLGRITYEGFAGAWPTVQDEAGFADRMNSIPKYVVSSTLTDPAWNNSHVLTDNFVEEIARLRDQPGQDILVAGSADLVQALVKNNLVDEYRLMVHPIIVGKGKRLFAEGLDTTVLNLVYTKSFSTGITVLTYEPGVAPEPGITESD